MKKSFLFSATVAVLFFVFGSCSNFMDGGDLKNKVDHLIAYNAEKPSFIRVSVNESQGDISPKGDVSVKVKDTFDIKFSMHKDYEFIDFVVFNSLNGVKISTNLVNIGSISSYESGNFIIYKCQVTVLAENSNLEIRPRCYKKDDKTAPVISGNIICASSLKNLASGNLLVDYTEEFDSDGNFRPDRGLKAHTGGKAFFKLNVLEEGGNIPEVKIHERVENQIGKDDEILKEYDTSINPVVEWAGRDLYSVSFEYEFKNQADGVIQLDVSLSDGVNSGETKSIQLVKDTKVYSQLIFHTDDPLYEKEGNYTSSTLKNARRKLYLRATKEIYCNVNDFDDYEEMSFEYAVSNNREELDSLKLKKVKPVADYSHSLPVEIDYSSCNSDKSVYIKGKITDSFKNERYFYYEMPGAPSVLSGQLKLTKTYFSGPIGASMQVDYETNYYIAYKELFVMFTKYNGETTLTPSFRVYYHGLGTTDEDFKPSNSLENNSVDAGAVACWWSDGGLYNPSNSLEITESDYYAQMYFSYKDINGEEWKLWGPLSEKCIAHLSEEQTALFTVDSANLKVSPADDKYSQAVEIAIAPSYMDMYDNFYVVNRSEVESEAFNFLLNKSPDGIFRFNIPTEKFFTSDNNRKEVNFELVGVKDGVEYPAPVTVPQTNSGNINVDDNVPPTVVTFSFDYTGKNKIYEITAFKDVGLGIEAQWVNVKYVKDDKIIREESQYLSTLIALKIPVGALYDSGANAVFSVMDEAGNSTEFKIEGRNGIVNTLWTREVRISPQASATYFEIQYDFHSTPTGNYEYSYDEIYEGDAVWKDKIHEKSFYNKKSTYFYQSAQSVSKEKSFVRVYIKDIHAKAYAGPFIRYARGNIPVSVKDVNVLRNGMQIYSNEPFFVHTLRCYGNLGDDYRLWEEVNTPESEVSPVCISETVYDKTPYYYSPDLSKINAGEYYVTIVYFADGTNFITEVKQK